MNPKIDSQIVKMNQYVWNVVTSHSFRFTRTTTLWIMNVPKQ